MRSFGVACSAGVLFCLLFSVSVLPSVVANFEPKPLARSTEGRMQGLGRVLLAVFRFASRRRFLVVGVTLLLACLCGGGMTRVQVRMEPRAFFRPGSEPALAQGFLDGTFGGAQFAQVLIEGDMADPRALSEVRRLTAFARSLPQVTQVQSVVEPLALVGEAMAGLHGLPATRGQVGTLLFFMEGEPSLRMLLANDRQAALVHVRLLGDAQPVLAELHRYLKSRWPFALRAPTAQELAEELLFLLPPAERKAREAAVLDAIAKVQSQGKNLGGPEPPPPPPQKDGDVAVDDGNEAALAARTRAANRVATEILLAALFSDGGRALSKDSRTAVELVAAGLLEPPQGPAPGAGDSTAASQAMLRGRLTGEPMLDRGFSRAVERNPWASLAVAIGAVLLALLIAQRSLLAALLSVLPALMALMVVFGTLGIVGRPIDLGTSLVGSIVTSSGADFAMHYIWYLRRRPAEEVVPTVGPVIFTTAALLGLGMGVMMLGGAPPLRLFGGLACAGMLLSAAFTFLLVPALLRLPASPLRTKKESL
jgi:predicted RND superfamily exporter protein